MLITNTDNSERHIAQLERAKRLTNIQMFTIELQIRRLRRSESEDSVFVLRRFADLQFLILALWRLRRAALIVKAEPSVNEAIKRFDQGLPGLKVMRDVGEHIEDYAIDSSSRHRKDKNRAMLEVGSWQDPIYEWMGETLNIDDAHTYAVDVFIAVRDAFRQCIETLSDGISGTSHRDK